MSKIRNALYVLVQMFFELFRMIDSTKVVLEETIDELEEVTRKVYDTTKLTRQDYDVIMLQYNIYKKCKAARGKDFKSTLEDVTIRLNHLLGYNKTRNSYSPIWRGEVTRESLGEHTGV
jgi:hypothetical protein